MNIEISFEIGIAAAAAFSAVLLLAEHYFPWETITGRKLPRLAAYVLGTFAMNLSLTALFALAGLWHVVLAQWTVIGVSGLAVLAAWLYDSWQAGKREKREAQEREQHATQRWIEDLVGDDDQRETEQEG